MHEDLMDQVVAEPNLARARATVKRNRGAAGIDRMTVDELEVHWQRHGAKMRAKLVAGRWTPSPTAGYGKPYVRWCGRVPGRNPRHPTRFISRPLPGLGFVVGCTGSCPGGTADFYPRLGCGGPGAN